MTTYPARQCALARILLGVYLAAHFAGLVPYAAGVYGRAGFFPLAFASPVPNPLVFPHALAAPACMVVLSALGLVLALGVRRRLVAFALWLGWALLVNRLPFIVVPSEGYLGWLLLAFVVMPEGEGGALAPWRDGWAMPRMIFAGAWIVMAASYTVSGLDKIPSPSWLDGSALGVMLESPIARENGLTEAMLTLPAPLMMLGTWMVLAFEAGFALLCVADRGRQVAWLGMVALHLGVLLVLDITMVSFGMLVFHAFTFDARWAAAWRGVHVFVPRPVDADAGVRLRAGTPSDP